MKVFLFVLFLNIENAPTIEEGWHPMPQDSYAECEHAADRVLQYLHEHHTTRAYVECLTYEEFLQLFL